MKRSFLRGATVLLLTGAVGWSAWFYGRYLQGFSPAVFGSFKQVESRIGTDRSPLSCPAGFELSVFTSEVPGARVLAFDPAGTLLVSLTREGKVVALPDRDEDGRADQVAEVLAGLNLPHGLVFSARAEKRLFVAETDRVTSYLYNPRTFQVTSPHKIADLPGGGRHSTRTLLFQPGSDEKVLLVSVGSSCNVCQEEDWRRAKILAVDLLDGSLWSYASGLRNAVFMTVRPGTEQIWATEMGRDYLGDDLPPDEIDIIESGRDYGWPDCYGKNVPDRDFLGANKVEGACRGKIPSFIDIPAHSAPLGLAFFPKRGWPRQYRGNLLVAYHGSWNRTVPTGYKVEIFRFDLQCKLLSSEDFISGWLAANGTSYGRPVDILITEKGTIYISDDKAGVIYRLALKK